MPTSNSNSSQKIQNPSTEFPKTPQMNDRDFLNDMLSTEKYLSNSYSVALNEASHKQLYDDLLAIYTETQNMQHQLYNLMFQKGWYKLEAESAQKIQQSYQQHTGYLNQFPEYGNLQ